MGKPAARKGDMGSNHGAWHPSPIISGSSDVTINGIPAARKGDSLAPHVKPKSSPHGRAIAGGSSTVLINGKPAARVGDAIDCGGKVIVGSGDVTIGDTIVLTKPDDVSLPDIDFGRPQSRKGPTKPTSWQPGTLSASGPVYIEHETTETNEEIEYKDAVVRINIPPKDASGDTFTLSASDGSYSVTKSMQDDLIPGDNYIDLLFTNLDTSKLYKLEHKDAVYNESTVYFDTYNYASMESLSADKKTISNTDAAAVSPHKLLPTSE